MKNILFIILALLLISCRSTKTVTDTSLTTSAVSVVKDSVVVEKQSSVSNNTESSTTSSAIITNTVVDTIIVYRDHYITLNTKGDTINERNVSNEKYISHRNESSIIDSINAYNERNIQSYVSEINTLHHQLDSITSLYNKTNVVTKTKPMTVIDFIKSITGLIFVIVFVYLIYYIYVLFQDHKKNK